MVIAHRSGLFLGHLCALTHEKEEEEQGHQHYDEAVLPMKFCWVSRISDRGLQYDT